MPNPRTEPRGQQSPGRRCCVCGVTFQGPTPEHVAYARALIRHDYRVRYSQTGAEPLSLYDVSPEDRVLGSMAACWSCLLETRSEVYNEPEFRHVVNAWDWAGFTFSTMPEGNQFTSGSVTVTDIYVRHGAFSNRWLPNRCDQQLCDLCIPVYGTPAPPIEAREVLLEDLLPHSAASFEEPLRFTFNDDSDDDIDTMPPAPAEITPPREWDTWQSYRSDHTLTGEIVTDDYRYRAQRMWQTWGSVPLVPTPCRNVDCTDGCWTPPHAVWPPVGPTMPNPEPWNRALFTGELLDPDYFDRAEDYWSSYSVLPRTTSPCADEDCPECWECVDDPDEHPGCQIPNPDYTGPTVPMDVPAPRVEIEETGPRPRDYAANCGEIHYYSWRPTPFIFHGDDDEADRGLHFGVEVECEHPDHRFAPEWGAGIVESYVDSSNIYCKQDGSLRNGFEMVSMPRTLASWHGFEPELDELMSALRAGGWRSWDQNKDGHAVGIHVHVSKSAFWVPETSSGGERGLRIGDARFDVSSRHLWMVQHLVYDNAEGMAAFAGRNDDYGSLRVGDMGRGYDENDRAVRMTPAKAVKAHKRGAEGNPNRGMAVNMQPASTIEFRMFRGSLNAKRIIANIEMVHALTEYSRGLTFQDWRDGAGEWAVFLMWLRKSGRYPHAASVVERNSKRRLVDANA